MDPKIKITADTAQAQKAIADLDKAIDSIKSSSALATKALAGVTAAAGAVTYAILQTIGAAGDLVDASDKLGITAQSLQQLHQAALLAGVGSDQLDASLQRLSANIGEGIAKGSGGAVDALNALNIPIQDIARQKPDEQFKRITEELLKIENPAQRVSTSMALLGKQGPALLKVAEELKKVKDLTTQTGFLVTERDLVAMDEASDAVDQLRILWDAGVKKAVAAISIYILAIAKAIKQAVIDAGGFEGIWKKITSAIRTVVNIVMLVGTILVTRVAAGAALVVVQLVRAAVAAKSLSVVLARTPIGLLTAGLAIAADYMGIDLVGGAGDLLDINLDLAGAQDDINAALDDRINKQGKSVDLDVRYHEEQKKVLAALDDTILKLQQTAQYEKDKLQYGEEEAAIRKIINDENDKLVKVGLTLTDKQKEMIRLTTEEANETARVGRLRQEQVGYLSEMLMSSTSLGKEFDKLSAMKLSFQGYDAKEIKQIQEAALKAADPNGDKALSNQRIRIKQQIDAELGKYDPLFGAATEYEKALANLDDIRLQAQQNKHSLTMDQETALYNSKILLDRKYNDEKTKILEEMAVKERALALETQGIVMGGVKLRSVGEQEAQQIAQEGADFMKKTELEKTKFALDNMQTVFAALGAQNKKAFEASKALAIASAMVNTYQGATKALATYPFPFGLIAAAAAVAAGYAQVSAIRAQQYSGRALGGPVMGNNSYIVGENGPELFTPNTTGSITRNNQLGGGAPTNISFTIVANDTEGFDQLLTSRKGVIQQIISDAMLERGQRM